MSTMINRYENTGERIPDDEDRSHWLPITGGKRLPPFDYGHLPTRWDWVQGVGWLPSLTEIYHRPGTNGVDLDSRGRPDPRGAHLGFTGKGGTLILRTDRRLPGGDYLRRHRCQDGAWHHSDTFDSFVKLGTRVVTKTDHEARQKWLLSLLEAGIIQPMAPEVFEGLIEREEARLARIAGDRFASPERIDEQRAKVEGMRADYVRQFEIPAEPAPETKRSRK